MRTIALEEHVRFRDLLEARIPPELIRAQGGSVAETILRHVHITTSGIFTQPPFLAALLTFGVDRILFSVDDPYGANGKGRAFLDALPLPLADREKIAHRNAERLLGLGGG
jgi:uncharacterized protein